MLTSKAIPATVPQKEHIFAASYLEPLAIRWKELNAQGRHNEAMLVLEEIVVGSTQMFQCLAQHEGYHHTVDIDILVAAAQEKIVKWLLRWERKKGRLFTWFSLYAKTPILLGDGTLQPIEKLVNEQYKGEVLCFNEKTGQVEKKRVFEVCRMPATRKEWRKLIVARPSGYQQPVYLTKEHLVLTQTGWTPADWLKSEDILWINEPRLTEDGRAALIGLYLGDGSILGEHFRITHGQGQRFYNDWLRDKFRGYIGAVEEGRRYFNRRTRRWIDQSGQSSVGFNALDLWPEFKNLPHPKHLTSWILGQVTRLSLAVWYMDDGSFVNGKVTFAAHKYTKDQCGLIMDLLRTKFGLIAHRHKPGGLYIVAESRKQFFDLIAPYVLDGFAYKLDDAHRSMPKIDPAFVEDHLTEIRHHSLTQSGERWWELRKKFKVQIPQFDPDWFKFKYDLSVEGNPNFFAGNCRLLIHNSTCSKNAFRSELVKINNIRKHYHFTSDNLEKFFGTEDHAVDKHDVAAEVRAHLNNITCRWGNPQEIGAIHYLIECILEEDHEKHAAIRGAAYTWGISMELSKFFYSWALHAMRDQMFRKIRVPFTEEDLVRAAHTYSYGDFISLFDMPNTPFTFNVHGKYLIAVWGGKRLKIPTLAQVAEILENKKIFDAIDESDKDPDSVAEVGQRFSQKARTAQQAYNQMVEVLDPRRSGEYEVYAED
jgi:hypothetical protein